MKVLQIFYFTGGYNCNKNKTKIGLKQLVNCFFIYFTSGYTCNKNKNKIKQVRQ